MSTLTDEVVVSIDTLPTVLTGHIDTVVRVGLAVNTLETLQTHALVPTVDVHACRLVLTTVVQAPVHF